jgi:MarR family transcriptional regulator, organic hydroperoxide resistance regulator
MKPEETVDFHIRWAWTGLSKTYNAAAAAHGGTMAMGYLLLQIDPEGTLSTRLGPRMGMEPTSLSRILRSLEDEGYIARKPDRKDGRKVWITLTPKGKKYRDITRGYVVALNRHIRGVIPAADLETFFRVIQTINSEFDRIKLIQ